MQWIFETLGIEPEADVGTIRKAYAKAIKQCDQASEAERFQKIRQAYELALQRAKQREAVESSQAAPPPLPSGASTRLSEQGDDDAQPVQSKRLHRPPTAPPVEAEQRALARAVMDDFVAALKDGGDEPVGGLLEDYAKDVRLTSLDEKSAFELGVLQLCFAPTPRIDLLDAACELFSWETSYKHLQVRADLVLRMQRHLQLLHLLAASRSNGAEEFRFKEAIDLYHEVQQEPKLRIEPWQIVGANRAIEQYSAFQRELNERYGTQVLDWWRKKLADNPTLLAAQQDRQAREKDFANLKVKNRPKQSTRSVGPSLFFLLPLLGVLNAIIGNSSQTSSYNYQAPYATQRSSSDVPPPLFQRDHSSSRSSYLTDLASLRRRAEAGDAAAADILGKKYETGVDVPVDLGIAAKWYDIAADMGFADAQYNLGMLYMQGKGVPKDQQLAFKWLEKAARGGQTIAQSTLAQAYADGNGVKQDYAEAYRWWLEASSSGNPSAENALGWLYETGHGVARNDPSAVAFYRRAASEKDAAGFANLGRLYQKGRGVRRNLVIAYALLSVAAKTEDADKSGVTAELAQLSSQLNVEQRRVADALATKLALSRNILEDLDDAASRHSTS